MIHLKEMSEEILYSCCFLSDIYVSPTFHTDFVMGIQEAMACGLPVVSTGQEFLVKDGINGYVVPKGNAQALTEAVLEIYQKDKVRKMGKESQKIIENYDWSAIVKKVIRRYEELLNNGNN